MRKRTELTSRLKAKREECTSSPQPNGQSCSKAGAIYNVVHRYLQCCSRSTQFGGKKTRDIGVCVILRTYQHRVKNEFIPITGLPEK